MADLVSSDLPGRRPGTVNNEHCMMGQERTREMETFVYGLLAILLIFLQSELKMIVPVCHKPVAFCEVQLGVWKSFNNLSWYDLFNRINANSRLFKKSRRWSRQERHTLAYLSPPPKK